ncbi:MAG: recombinase family protein [Dokdonella sp.]|nr:recombinase family protein [Dokdonella sp.]
MTKAAIYLRVSTDGQTTEHQRRELAEVAARRGWEVVEFYEDAGISGSKGRDKRPALDRMLKDATRKRFDVIAAWSVDRLGRSLPHLVEMLGEIHGVGCDLYLHQQAVDTATPSGRALFGMMGVFAEFERAMIRERVMAGLATARKRGVKLGRRRVGGEVEGKIRALRQQGHGMLKIAKEVGCGVSVVQRVLN